MRNLITLTIAIICISFACSSNEKSSSSNDRAVRAQYYDYLNEIDQEAYDRFIQENNAIISDAGLTYYFIKRGSVDQMSYNKNAKMMVHYRNKIIDSEKWDDSSFVRDQPAEVPSYPRLTGSWKLAMPLLRVGDRIVFLQPPKEAASLNNPTATGRLLLFEVEVLEIDPSAGPSH